MSTSPRCIGIIFLTFFGALVLTAVPLPEWLRPFMPEWTALVLIYWSLALPNRVGVGMGWVFGLLVDVLKGTLLGQHALGFTVTAFIAVKLHQRMRVHPRWQQAFFVFGVLLLNQLLVLWIYGMMGRPPTDWQHWASTVTGAVLWPLAFGILRWTRRNYRVT